MAPKQAPSTPKRSRTLHHEFNHEFSTPFKCYVIGAIDKRGNQTIQEVCTEIGVSTRNVRKWQSAVRIHGSPALHRTGRNRTGRPLTLSDAQLRQCFSPSNQDRTKSLDFQIKKFELPINKQNLSRNFRKRTSGVRKYRQRVVKKLTEKSKQKRVHYGKTHESEDFETFWKRVHFTDEAHIDPSEEPQGLILREQGTALNPENLQERSDRSGTALHIACSISWNHKSDLIFYNDPDDQIQILKPQIPRKPLRSKYESDAEYDQRLRDWEAEKAKLPHPIDLRPKGNSMTQQYYADHILPKHIEWINRARINHYGNEISRAILQEDNDPSHGHRSARNPPELLRQSNWIEVLEHPAYSPDLNPVEAIWAILKQRYKKRHWRNKQELKKVLLEEWENITQEEIQARISEMPWRCREVQNRNGMLIRSSLW
jgi:transposase